MTTQQEKNRMFRERFYAKIERNAPANEIELGKVQSSSEMMTDFIAPLGQGRKMSYNGNGSLKVFIEGDNYDLHDNAVGQVCDKLKVPRGYLKGLRDTEWGRMLAAQILNEHSDHTQRERVLVRAVGNSVKAVLSDHYRRLDSPMIFGSFIEQSAKMGAVVYSSHCGEVRNYMEMVIPQVLEIPTNDGEISMAFGISLSNSDFGQGSLQLRSFLIHLACLNGMMGKSESRMVHLGGKLPDNLQLSQQTYTLDAKTTASTVSDLTKGLLSREAIIAKSEQIQDAAHTEVDIPNEIKKLEKVGVLKSEAEAMEKVLMGGREDDGVAGPPTLWKVSQGITAVAREASEQRRRELETIGGELLIK